MKSNNIEKYANLVIYKGLNIQKNQPLIISAEMEHLDFVRLLVKAAYEKGASKVIVDWNDDEITKLNFEYQDIENFKKTPEYLIKRNEYLLKEKFAFLRIAGTDPEALKSIDSKKIMELQKTNNRDLKEKSIAQMSDRLSWCVIAAPTYKWAKKTYPKAKDPKSELWDAILKATRCDTLDPIKEWEDHIKILEKKAKTLNDNKFEKMIFTNELGTNISVGLVKDHIWMAAESQNKVDKNMFIANIPTEEIYTMPDKNNVDGVVYSSKPLNYQGNLIDEMRFEFKEGKIISVTAKKGNEILNELVNIDEGAKSIGEVALVSYNTPISLSNTLFYNTLFDENASCHLALGRAYPTCMKNTENMTKEESSKKGMNDSAIHVDFMFGTKDMKIVGIKEDGTTIDIFVDGNFV